jgi:hypothetical protein
MTRRGRVVIGAVLLSLLAGCGQSQTQTEIDQHDPQEVQLLRDQAKQSKIQLDDTLLLSTLQTRDDCRTIKAALEAMTAGQKTGSAITKFTALPADNRARGQNDKATYFQGMVDKAMLGDPSQAKDYHDQSCADTP